MDAPVLQNPVVFPEISVSLATLLSFQHISLLRLVSLPSANNARPSYPVQVTRIRVLILWMCWSASCLLFLESPGMKKYHTLPERHRDSQRHTGAAACPGPREKQGNGFVFSLAVFSLYISISSSTSGHLCLMFNLFLNLLCSPFRECLRLCVCTCRHLLPHTRMHTHAHTPTPNQVLSDHIGIQINSDAGVLLQQGHTESNLSNPPSGPSKTRDSF